MDGYTGGININQVMLGEIRDIKAEVTSQGKDLSAIRERVANIEKCIEEQRTSKAKVRMAIVAATLSLIFSLVLTIIVVI